MPPKPTKGSITQTADAMENRANNISNVSNAINRMQKDVDQKIAQTREEVKDDKQIQQIHNNMNQTLSKLNQTIGAITTGVGKITADTAKATAGAINQYGKAISDDISFNKKSVVAMALAKTSPLYGYFVAKFMETNVWKQALNKMRTSIMQTMGAILRPFKGGAARGGKVPHAQTGGYIGQSGLAKVHAGETITPAGGGGMGGVGLEELISIQRQQLSYMEKTFGMQQRFYKGSLVMRVIRKFRRTRGNYVAQLSTEERPLINIAENVATLYSGMMWRLDNMFLVMKAQAEAARDLSSHVTGARYQPIKGIRLRSLVKPLVRKMLGGLMKAMPALGMLGAGAMGGPLGALGMAGISGMVLGRKGLHVRERRRIAEAKAKGEEYQPGIGAGLIKKRGAYANYKEPGFMANMKSKFSRMFPGRRDLEGGMAGGGGLGEVKPFGGRIVGFTSNKKRALVHQGKLLGKGFSFSLGGRRGFRKPIWIANIDKKRRLRYEKFSTKQITVQTKQLKQIKEGNKKSLSLARKAYNRAAKWRMWDKIMGWVKMGMSAIGSVIGKIVDLFGGMLSGVFSNPKVWGALAAALAAAGLALWANNKIIKPFLDFLYNEKRAKSREAQGQIDTLLGAQSKISATTGGKTGYRAQTMVKALQFGQHEGLGTDASLGLIRKGQADFIQRNIRRYEQFPMDKISVFREEWKKTTPEGLGERIFSSPYEYGSKRESSFLQWMEKNKKAQTPAEIQKEISNRDKKYFSDPASKARTAEADAKMKNQTANSPLADVKDRKILIQNHLKNKYGLDHARAMEIASHILFSGGMDIKNHQQLIAFTDEVYQKYKGTSWLDKAFSREKTQFREIGKDIRERDSAKINNANIVIKEARILENAARSNDPVVAELKDLNKRTDNWQRMSTSQTQNNYTSSSTNVNSSENSSTSVGGGGGGNFGSLPPDHLMGLNVYGRGR